ncbi:hypothetical protein [Moraxella lacunata]
MRHIATFARLSFGWCEYFWSWQSIYTILTDLLKMSTIYLFTHGIFVIKW